MKKSVKTGDIAMHWESQVLAVCQVWQDSSFDEFLSSEKSDIFRYLWGLLNKSKEQRTSKTPRHFPLGANLVQCRLPKIAVVKELTWFCK